MTLARVRIDHPRRIDSYIDYFGSGGARLPRLPDPGPRDSAVVRSSGARPAAQLMVPSTVAVSLPQHRASP
jgi:hypothetical protein